MEGMLKKIICPVDFSPAAMNGAQYAAKLAQLSGAVLHFINVVELTPLDATVNALVGGTDRVSRLAKENVDRMEELCAGVNKLFGVSAAFEVNAGAAPFYRLLGGADTTGTLLVTGSNGEDDLMQRMFGSESYRLMNDWPGPVLVIPEQVSYGTVKKIVYVWGAAVNEHFSLGMLRELAAWHDAPVVCLHADEPGSIPDRHVYDSLREHVRAELRDERAITYESLVTDDVVRDLLSYMRSANADLLAVNYRRSERLITPLKSLAGKATFPLLVMPA